jgi:dihydrodipicolinate synthase/N-acetylneuraminate lyase
MILNQETVMPVMTNACTEKDRLNPDTFNHDPGEQLKSRMSGIITEGTPGKACTLTEEGKEFPAQNAADKKDDRLAVICNIDKEICSPCS